MDIATYHNMWNKNHDLFDSLEDFLIKRLDSKSFTGGTIGTDMHTDTARRFIYVRTDEFRHIVIELLKMYVARQDADCYKSDKAELVAALASHNFNDVVASNVFNCTFGKVDWNQTDLFKHIVVFCNR